MWLCGHVVIVVGYCRNYRDLQHAPVTKSIELVIKGEFGLGQEDCQQAMTDEFLCWLLFLEQIYLIGCLKQSQHGSRSRRFFYKCL